MNKIGLIVVIILLLIYLYQVNFNIPKNIINNELDKYVKYKNVFYPGNDNNFFNLVKTYKCNNFNKQVMVASELCRLFYRKDADEEKIYDYDLLPEPKSRKQYLFENNFTQLKFFDDKKSGTVASIVKDNISNKHYLIFRGTEQNLTDITTDLNFGFSSLIASSNKEIIHKGFNKAYKSIENKIMNYINNELYNIEIIVTGHSLGASLATLFIYYKFLNNKSTDSVDLNNKPTESVGLNKYSLIIFGSPLVGNKRFVETFNYITMINNIQCYRINNGVDVVPILAFPFTRYKHVDNEILLHPIKKNFILIGNYKIFKKYISEPPSFISDHAPINYTKNLIQYHP